MAQLAIKGHETHGKEVIRILEMLGGKSYTALPYQGDDIDRYYYINKGDNYINAEPVYRTLVPKFQSFTLERFLEKFPYKTGDQVRVPEYESEVCISKMYWDGNEVQYEVVTDEVEWYSAKELNEFNDPNKEETTEKNKIFNEVLDTLSSYLIDFMTPQGIDKCIKYIRDNMDEYNKEELKEEIKIDIPKGYEFAGVDDNKQQVVFTKIQPKYPKTYEECCTIIGFYSNTLKWDNPFGINRDTHPYIKHLDNLIESFCKLLVCRDAYWKIAGEQMGLGKPWEPDFTNDNEERYGIYTTANKVVKDFCGVGDVNVILTFPTEEMRDAFYENFKELIEQCKKLL